VTSEMHAVREPLPLAHWDSVVGASDLRLLDHCVGPTLDVGCGPGRMTAHLARHGARALGIDVSPEAIGMARSRGARALRRDIFDPIPDEGEWGTALLADGNVGIGGDPTLLLRRVHQVVAPDGRAVVDVAEHGEGCRTTELHLGDGGATKVLPWAVVGADAISSIAAESGWSGVATHEFSGRWFAVLTKGRG
jgi:SAM-dependent methyltransferase